MQDGTEGLPTPEALAGQAIRRLREARGWSQRELANRMTAHGFSWQQSTVGKTETARRPLRVNELMALALLFDTKPISLLQQPVPFTLPERLDGTRDDDLPQATAQAEESHEEVPAQTGVPREELTQLVRASADGNEAAWNELVRRYNPLVLGVTRRYQLGPADAQDISQTVWLRLVEQLAQIREPENLPGWLVTTTQRECVRYHRRTQRLIPVDPHNDEVMERATTAGPDTGILQAELRQAVRDGLQELPSQDQLFLSLRMADPPLSYQEISQRLGMPIGSIGPTARRSLDKLRRSRAVQAYMAADAPANRASVGSGGAA